MKDEKIYMTAAAENGTVKLSNGFRGPIEQPSEIVPINAPNNEIAPIIKKICYPCALITVIC